MDKIERELKKLNPKEKLLVKDILEKIKITDIYNLDVKKLKGRDDIFRVRKGKLRIIYRKIENNILVLAIEKRNDNTYKDY